MLRRLRWPMPLRDMGKAFVQSLGDADFRALCKLVATRAKTLTSSKKHARKLVAKMRKRRRAPLNLKIRRRGNSVEFRHSTVLEAFCPGRSGRWLSEEDRSRNINLDLENFSFHDSPVSTMLLLRELAFAETECYSARVNFEDRHMLDVGPYLVLGLMRQHMAPFVSGGHLPLSTRRALEATDLSKYLRIQEINADTNGAIVPFKLHRRGSTQLTDRNIGGTPSTKEKTTEALVKAVISWLSENGELLTREGETALASLSNEILENAERHANPGESGDWSVAGLMEKRKLNSGIDREVMVCNFAFVSVGETISKTIGLTMDPRVRRDLAQYVQTHSKGRSSGDVLATLLATQDGMTRTAQSLSAPGGLGLMSAVDAVAGLGDELVAPDLDAVRPCLTIISGDSCIRFAGPYLKSHTSDNALRYQWLNEGQTPRDAPDKSYAHALPVAFPGTIISARFVLAGLAVEDDVEGGHEPKD